MDKVIILLGPTGVGKTEAAILLAKKLNTEIISADSMQIYRGMDIGTAKPSKEQMADVRHHMIDIVRPSETYSVGKYIEDVKPAIEGLHRKGKIPIVVGGTGLYIRAMTRGIFSGPSADWELREELNAIEEDQKGALYNYLQKLDPDAASQIMPSDTRRIIRALEVGLKAKQGISKLRKKLTRPLPYEFIKVGLARDRKELYKIIEARVDRMILDGLVDEAKRLIETLKDAKTRRPAEEEIRDAHRAAVLPRQCINELPSMQAIGYKEIAMHLNGDITLEETIRLIKRNSKRYAKRQFTWFKKEADIRWVDITGIYDSSEIYEKIRAVFPDPGALHPP